MTNVQHLNQQQTVVLMAGDSGDGIQLVGYHFATTLAQQGQHITSLPSYPAEIRAPIGTRNGVSGIEISMTHHQQALLQQQADILLAMNPAALLANIERVKDNGLIIINDDYFNERWYKKANIDNPIEIEEVLSQYHCLRIPLLQLTKTALKTLNLTNSQIERCKNMLLLGIAAYLLDLDIQIIIKQLRDKFGDSPLSEANNIALKAGFHYAEMKELHYPRQLVKALTTEPGTFRQLSGNQALALACRYLATTSNTNVVFAGYPITPASTLLHDLMQNETDNLTVCQAEDEIAAAGMALGAAFAGAIALTCTSGPGLDLKAETIGLAVMTELPMIIIDVQRGGPSTGLPTKAEQADLFMAIYGRHGDAPIPVIAPATPAECFDLLLSAANIAINYMTPIIFLSDATLAIGTQTWRIPDEKSLPIINANFVKEHAKNFQPYEHSPPNLVRPWAIPGTAGNEHQIGGLEKTPGSGEVNYQIDNHQTMNTLRAEKINHIATDYPPLSLETNVAGKLLIISWGSTLGLVRKITQRLNLKDNLADHCHCRFLFPIDQQLIEYSKHYEDILVLENNRGQYANILASCLAREIKSMTITDDKIEQIDEVVDLIHSWQVATDIQSLHSVPE